MVANPRKLAAEVDEIPEDLVEVGAKATRAIEASTGLMDGLEILTPGGFGNPREIESRGKVPTSPLKGGHQERAVTNGAAGRALVSGDETFMAPRVAEDAFESVVGGRQIRVIVAGEEVGSEMPGRLEHLFQDRRPRGLGVTLDGLSNFRKQSVERAGDPFRGSLRIQERGGPPDETVEEPHVAGRGFGDVQGDADVLGELAQQKR